MQHVPVPVCTWNGRHFFCLFNFIMLFLVDVFLFCFLFFSKFTCPFHPFLLHVIYHSSMALIEPVTDYTFLIFHKWNFILRTNTRFYQLSLHIWAFTDSSSEHAIFFSWNETACLATLPQITNSVFILSSPPFVLFTYCVVSCLF